MFITNLTTTPISTSIDQTFVVMGISAIFFLITIFTISSILPSLSKKKWSGLNCVVFIVLIIGWCFISKISNEVWTFKNNTHSFSEEKVFLYNKSDMVKELEYKYLYPRFYALRNNSEQNAPKDTLDKLNQNSEKVCIRFIQVENNELFSDLCAQTPEQLAREYYPLHDNNPNFINFMNNTHYDKKTNNFFNRFKQTLDTLSLIE